MATCLAWALQQLTQRGRPEKLSKPRGHVCSSGLQQLQQHRDTVTSERAWVPLAPRQSLSAEITRLGQETRKGGMLLGTLGTTLRRTPSESYSDPPSLR